MTKVCARCKIEDGPFASIHEHHKNGIHEDNRPENKMDLCANCHATLHWKRWKLSDIGMEDVVIQRGSMIDHAYDDENFIWENILEEWADNKKDLSIKTRELDELRERMYKRGCRVNKMFLQIERMCAYYDYTLQNTIIEYVDKYYHTNDSDPLPGEDDILKILNNPYNEYKYRGRKMIPPWVNELAVQKEII